MKTFSLNKIIAIFALLFFIGGGKTLAETTATLQASSTDPSLGKPEFAYTINNVNVLDGPTIDYGYWNVNLYSVVNSPANAASFAFYAVAGKSNTYYIYNYSAKKWVTYDLATSYNNNMKGFLKLSDTKTEGCYFEITSCTNDTHSGYQMRPYASDGTIDEDCYLNYNGGNGANVSLTVGLWKDPGSQDKGACWILKKVDLGVNSIQTSTNEAKPEHVFTMRNANNSYVNSNLYCATSTSDYAQFAFYEVSGKTSAYYIYNYSAKKWLKYTTSATYTKGQDFVFNGEKSERSEFYITDAAKDGVSGVQIQPYNAAGNAANNYLNFYKGGDQNTNNTIGNYTTDGNNDAGSLWVFTEVEIANNNAVITNKTMSEGSVVSTLLENHTGDGTKILKETAIDWTKQKVIAEIDISTCGTGTEDLFSIGNKITEFYENNIHMYKTTGGITAYLVGNPVSGGATAFGPVSFDGNILRVELSSEKGFVVNDRVIFSKDIINQYSEQKYSKQFFSLSSIQVGSGENNQNSKAKYNFIRVVTNDYQTATVTSSNTLDEVAVNTFNAQNDVDVQLKRTLSPEYWNTFCVPFTISEDVIAEKFGAGTQVCTFGSMNGNVMNFAHSTNIEAGKPYIVKPTKEVVNPSFTGVNIEAVAAKQVGANGYFMQGIYSVKTDLTTDGTNLFLGDGNKFYKPSGTTTAKMKGMRAYFIVPQGTNLAALRANIDGATTAIDELTTVVEQPIDNRIYNLQGQFVGTSFEGLHGVYVQNGKKVLVK
ncbi:hypothetical protein [Leyella stercorea]|uniref:hypothetical protein n=1 Tax=Leyella stercorea TaxID=363265 RepID=UPI003F7ED40B